MANFVRSLALIIMIMQYMYLAHGGDEKYHRE
jgi:hypothetical protein